MARIVRLVMSSLVFFASVSGFFAASAQENELRPLLYFYSASCHVCHEINTTVVDQLLSKYPSAVRVEKYDIGVLENYKKLLELRKQYAVPGDLRVPTIVYGENFYVGKASIMRDLVAALNSVGIALTGIPQENVKGENAARGSARVSPSARMAPAGQTAEQLLIEHFGTIAPLTVAGAGLVDGINPCAFTVIVFFISFLSVQGYRRRQIAVIGLSFISAVFLTYLLLGGGEFQVFYSMRFFWALRMAVNYIIGAATAVLGVLAVRDLIVFARTGSTEAMALQLPESVKKRIHSVIGDHYRRRGAGGEKKSFSLIPLIASAFATGFLVSLLEAVCTGQVYLPTITFVLKTTQVKLLALAYLLVYNIMFVVPLLAIFVLALLGVGSGQFSGFFKKHFIAVKAVMALLFFGLAFLLFWNG